MPQKILFLVPYPLKQSPSQRFRFEQYFDLLTSKGFRFEVQSFLNSQNWQVFFKPGHLVEKALALMNGFARRILVLTKVPGYDFIFIHREVTPVGPPVFEWLISHVFKKKIIYDFDDAIWLTDRADESLILRVAKWRAKVGSISRWAHKVSCGNNYLMSYATTFNEQAMYIPTTIDTEHWHNPDRFLKKDSTKADSSTVVGWTGSHSTLKYLNSLEPVLQKLESEYPKLKILVIADRKPNLALHSLTFLPWNEATEIDDLLTIDIGIMPLPDDEWAKGKCGFKALQYMALKIPAVVSPVGVNTAIVDEGINGYLASESNAWFVALKTLIDQEEIRKKMGEAGRKKIIESYSVSSNSAAFLALFA
jgi:glycosyltransferase involved in cell wall biosynthesis